MSDSSEQIYDRVADDDHDVEEFDVPKETGDESGYEQDEEQGTSTIVDHDAGHEGQGSVPEKKKKLVARLKDFWETVSFEHFLHTSKEFFFDGWWTLNWLLLCIPVSWILHFVMREAHKYNFVFSFLAILPLAKLLSNATEELATCMGEALAALLCASLGNAVELIVSIFALLKCEILVVQLSLVGSILSNLLLVLGLCFFMGGTRFSEQGFHPSVSQLNTAILFMAAGMSAVLTMVYMVYEGETHSHEVASSKTLLGGRLMSTMLFTIYIGFTYFQLSTHKGMFDENAEGKPKTVNYAARESNGIKPSIRNIMSLMSFRRQKKVEEDGEKVETVEPSQEEEEEKEHAVGWEFAVLLLVVTGFVALTAEFLVDSLDGFATETGVPKMFISVVLLPIVGNAAEHVTALTVAMKDKLTLSVGVAVGSAVQIAVGVIPFVVILGWILDKPLGLAMDPVLAVVLISSIIVVLCTTQDGKSNWMEGVLLVFFYLAFGVIAWIYPGVTLGGLLVCSE